MFHRYIHFSSHAINTGKWNYMFIRNTCVSSQIIMNIYVVFCLKQDTVLLSDHNFSVENFGFPCNHYDKNSKSYFS